ncbi:helix-turn-helix transcriptional regulator [Vibrio tubiashii]|uniref:Helix-turn-helix transcriptional regulator n=1 Tax=Vibrio tubiashii TaxID=29498 RepID=A0AAE5LIU9_9VIBR|nr:AraC family transcriptional regulator [Vibrio tubiashii]NOI82016.1 helix-turn-helix transcriptional regulator [Vibrio tubiashii]
MPTAELNTHRLRKVAITQKVEESEKQLIVGETKHGQAPLVEGQFLSYNVAQRVNMHGCRSLELQDSNVVSMAPSSVIITVLLEGKLRFSYDDLEFKLDSSQCGKVTLVNLNQPTNFRRQITKNNCVTKLNIMMNHDWIKARTDGNCQVSQFIASHKNFLQFDVTPEIESLVTSAISLYQASSFEEKIALESIGFQLMESVFGKLATESFNSKETDKSAGVPSSVEDIICYIESHLGDPLSVDLVAEHFSMSSSNLQRKFKQQLGVTVSGFIRRRRLDVAKQHLERGLVTITEAAYEAGYNHPANFTNAFKKEYGIPPISIATQNENPTQIQSTQQRHQISNIYTSYK